MSILDKDLVDQRTFEEQFMEMLYELYEIMMDGKLIADEVDKYPFVERGIGGLMWRLSGVQIKDIWQYMILMMLYISRCYIVLRMRNSCLC